MIVLIASLFSNLKPKNSAAHKCQKETEWLQLNAVRERTEGPEWIEEKIRTQITKGPNAEAVRIEDPAKTAEQIRNKNIFTRRLKRRWILYAPHQQ